MWVSFLYLGSNFDIFLKFISLDTPSMIKMWPNNVSSHVWTYIENKIHIINVFIVLKYILAIWYMYFLLLVINVPSIIFWYETKNVGLTWLKKNLLHE
jgi:hypothetical protein